MKMIEKRYGAASVALDQNTLWIVGGYNGSSLRSTEFIKLGQPSMDPLSKVSAYRILLRTGLNNYKKVKKPYILLSQLNLSLLKKVKY